MQEGHLATWLRRHLPERAPGSADVALWVILGVAAVFRFWYLNAIEHTIDHAFPVWQALQTLELGRWPVTSQGTSVAFDNPALLGYLYLPLMAVFRSVLAVYGVVIALNTLAVWLVYRTAHRLFGDGRALIAAALMAMNPWLVEYSRAIWLPALLPFFTALVTYLLFPLLSEDADVPNPARRVALGLIAFALMTQTYLLGFVPLASLALLVVLFWKRWPRRALLIGGAVFAALTAVYLAGLLSHRGATVGQVGSFVGEPFRLSDEAWGHAVRLVSGEDYELARGRQAPIDDAALRHALSRAAHWLILASLLAGIGFTAYSAWRRQGEWRLLTAALIWFGVPVVLMTYANQVVHPYYLLVSLPGGYLLAAAGAGLLWRWRWGQRALALLGVLLVPLFGTNVARYYQETRAIPGAHNLWALPLDAGLEMGRAIRELTDGQPAPRRVAYEWESQIVSSLSGVTVEADNDAVTNLPQFAVILPDGGPLYVLFDDGSGLDAPPGADEVSDRAIELADGTAIRFYRYERSADDLLADFAPRRVDWPDDSGLTLVGYALDAPPAPGETVVLTTCWRVERVDNPARVDWLFAPFVHVLDANGETVLNVDGVPVPGARWQVGALYVQRMVLDVPAGSEGPFVLEVGQWDPLREVNMVFWPPDEEPTPVYRIEGQALPSSD